MKGFFAIDILSELGIVWLSEQSSDPLTLQLKMLRICKNLIHSFIEIFQEHIALVYFLYCIVKNVCHIIFDRALLK